MCDNEGTEEPFKCYNVDTDGICKVDGRECSIMSPSCVYSKVQVLPRDQWFRNPTPKPTNKTLTDW